MAAEDLVNSFSSTPSLLALFDDLNRNAEVLFEASEEPFLR